MAKASRAQRLGRGLARLVMIYQKANMKKITAVFRSSYSLLKSLFHPRQHKGLQINHKSLSPHFIWLSVGVCFALVLCFNTDLTYAQEQAPGIFEFIERKARDDALGPNGWLVRISDMARTTFIILAGLEICWAAAIWALEKDNLNSLAVEMIQKIMFIGFFYALLLNAHDWIPRIIETFRAVGQSAPGAPAITPDGVMDRGLRIIQNIWAAAPKDLFGILGQLGEILVAVFVTLGVVISHVVIALQLLALNVESYIVLAAGAFLLALGSTRWTSEYVSKYLQYSLTLGMRLLVLLLILSLTNDAVDQNQIVGFNYGALLRLFATVLMQAILAVKAPEMGSALMSGGIGFSAGSGASAISNIASKSIGSASTAMSAARGTLKTGASSFQGAGNLANLARGGGAAKGGASTLSSAASVPTRGSPAAPSGTSMSSSGSSSAGSASNTSSASGSPNKGRATSPSKPEQDSTSLGSNRGLLGEVGRTIGNQIKGKAGSTGWVAPEGMSDSERAKLSSNPGPIHRALLNKLKKGSS